MAKLYFAQLYKRKTGTRTAFHGHEMPFEQGELATEVKLDGETLKSRILPDSGESLCKQQVNPSYIREGIRNNDVFMLLYYKMVETGRRNRKITTIVPAAFLMANVKQGHDLYIDVVCASAKRGEFQDHSGNYLIKKAIETARYMKLNQVSLSALPQVLTYYPSLGFLHRKSCNAPPDVLPTNSNFTTLLQRAKRRELPNNANRAHDDEQMLDYMTRLYNLGYAKQEGECSRKLDKKSKNVVKEGRCGRDGFRMVHCLDGRSR
jgi:hypothetical protein